MVKYKFIVKKPQENTSNTSNTINTSNISDTSYTKLSIDLTKKIKKEEKKKHGIFFTPPQTIINMIQLLSPYFENIKDVLEPSCGTCEFILRLNQIHTNLNITGVELNKTIFESIKDYEKENVTLLNEDFLNHNEQLNYDLVIGNPPFFVMKKEDVEEQYYDYFEGRPNLFILFIIKSIKLLKENGLLCFVLPKNFVNCSYYDKTRKFIRNNFQILNIIECNDKYINTQQDTIVILLKKINQMNEINNNSYLLDKGSFTIFGTKDSISQLKELYTNSTNLKSMNFNLSIGTVVWNQCKDILTNDNSKTLLIYSGDIKNKRLEIKKYKNESKKNFIDKEGNTGPIFVINRGYGKGAYKFEYCLIDQEGHYLIENHLISVKYNIEVNKEELINLYEKIINSFENEKTSKFIKLYFGNNAINISELSEILPIYDI